MWLLSDKPKSQTTHYPSLLGSFRIKLKEGSINKVIYHGFLSENLFASVQAVKTVKEI